MATNAGKRLDKLERQLDALHAKNKRHHFVVCTPGVCEAHEMVRMAKAGTLNEGDDVQVINVPWTIHTLSGATHIPEGSTDDPFADPRTRGTGRGVEGAPASSPAPDLLPTAAQEQRWREHERKIELDGQRYQGDATYTRHLLPNLLPKHY